jgi:uncharacterized protein YecE (DUF72 family)
MWFCFPSKKTLSNLLQRIPIDSGYNEAIFDNLKANVRQLSERERKCIVMFDEVSIEPHVLRDMWMWARHAPVIPLQTMIWYLWLGV